MLKEPGSLKTIRQKAIISLIENGNIGTQNELLERLQKEGFAVTQATISRDIRELRLIKVAEADGSYHYEVGQSGQAVDKHQTTSHLTSIFMAAVDKIDYANNLVLVKCHTGMAQAVCATIDGLNWKNVVGTVSGDDTILIVTRNEESAIELIKLMEEINK